MIFCIYHPFYDFHSFFILLILMDTTFPFLIFLVDRTLFDSGDNSLVYIRYYVMMRMKARCGHLFTRIYAYFSGSSASASFFNDGDPNFERSLKFTLRRSCLCLISCVAISKLCNFVRCSCGFSSSSSSLITSCLVFVQSELQLPQPL